MPKSGLFNRGGGTAGTFIPQQSGGFGDFFKRGQGGILPERGSQQQFDIVTSLLQSGLSSARNSGSPFLNLVAPMVAGAVGSRTQGLYNEGQEERRNEAVDRLMQAMGGGGGGISVPMRTGGAGEYSVGSFRPPSIEEAMGLDMGTTGDLPRNPSVDVGGVSYDMGQGSLADHIRYANEGAVRNQELSSDLTQAMSFLPEMGITMEVFSGGQPGIGTSDRRVGSTRHDHGNAADVVFYKDGRMLDWSNPADIPLFQEIVQRGKANGLTGFGAGPGYMRPGSMHIGYGNPAVWGAGGKGSNAPAWLREAYEAGGAPSTMGRQYAQANTGTQMDTRALLDLMTDRTAPEGIQSAAASLFNSMLSSQQGPSELDQIRLEQERLKLAQMMAGGEPSAAQAQIERLVGIDIPYDTAVKLQAGVYRTIVDPITREPTIVDLATGQPVHVVGQGGAGQPSPTTSLVDAMTAPEPQVATPDPVTGTPNDSRESQEASPPLSNADEAFGLEGQAKRTVNAVSDFVGAGTPFENARDVQDFFSVLQEDMVNAFAQSYGRQPTGERMNAIQALTAQAGGFQGPEAAQSKLRALKSQWQGDLEGFRNSARRRLRPADRAVLEGNIQRTESMIAKIDQALAMFGASEGETPVTNTTQTGVKWRIKQ